MKEKENSLALVQTSTEEVYFPSRLTYRVFAPRPLMEALNSLSCVHKDPLKKRLLVQCEEEALAITNWGSAYRNKHQNGEPVVIATIRFPKTDAMQVYLRCYERVTPVLELIDTYVPRSVAIGIHHDRCFKLITSSSKEKIPTPEQVFSNEKKIHYPDTLRRIDELEERARKTGKDYSNQIDKLFNKEVSTNRSKKVWLNDLERNRLEVFYVDGASNYAQSMFVQKTMGLAKHLAGGKLDVKNFFEKTLRSEGKPITDIKEFLN